MSRPGARRPVAAGRADAAEPAGRRRQAGSTPTGTSSTPGYFTTMKMALVSGRDFTDADRAGAPSVVIVNETAARRCGRIRIALGKVLVQHVDRRGSGRLAATDDGDRRGEGRQVSRSSARSRRRSSTCRCSSSTCRARRSSREPRDGRRLAADIRTLLASMNPNLPIVQCADARGVRTLGLIPQRIAASVAGSLGIVGLLLAAIGIYGVTAYMVTSRTREIGIRIALGAQRGSVVRMVLRQGMMLTLIGAAIGLALAAAVSRLLGSLLFGVGADRSDHVRRIGGCSSRDRPRRLLRARRAARRRSMRWKRSGTNRAGWQERRDRQEPPSCPALPARPALPPIVRPESSSTLS